MKTVSFMFVMLCMSCTLIAQQTDTKLKELINSSFEYFPKFEELNQNVIIAENNIDVAKTYYMPVVNGTGNYQYAYPASKVNMPTAGGGFNTFQIMPNDKYHTTLNASYMIYNFGAVKANVDKAKSNLKLEKNNIELNKAEMAYQVATIYYQIIYTQKQIKIKNIVLDFLNKNKQDTEIKLKLGDALKYDILSIQSSIYQAQNEKTDLENTLEKQYNLLYYTTGNRMQIDKDDLQFVYENQYANKESEALGLAKANNYLFKLQDDKIELAEKEVQISKTLNKPSLAANASTGFMNGIAPESDKFRFNYLAGITLTIPIYQGGFVKKKRVLAENQLELSKSEMKTLENLHLKDLREAITDIKTNDANISFAKRQVSEAQEAQNLAQSRYKNGIGTNLELTNASTNVQIVLLTQLRYELQLCFAQLQLTKLLGDVYWK